MHGKLRNNIDFTLPITRQFRICFLEKSFFNRHLIALVRIIYKFSKPSSITSITMYHPKTKLIRFTLDLCMPSCTRAIMHYVS